MRKIWAVTRGSYSDYRVQALFATKEQAQHHLAVARGTSGDIWNRPEDIEEFDFYDEGEEPVLVTEYSRMAEVWDDGRVTQEREGVRTEWDYDPLFGRPTARPSVRFVRAPIHKDKGGRLEIRGTDKQAVDQAFSDNLAQLKVAAGQTGKADLPIGRVNDGTD